MNDKCVKKFGEFVELVLQSGVEISEVISQAKYKTLKASHTNLVDACRAGGIELEFCLSNHEMDTPEMKRLLDTLAMIEQALADAEKI